MKYGKTRKRMDSNAPVVIGSSVTTFNLTANNSVNMVYARRKCNFLDSSPIKIILRRLMV